MSGVRRRHQTTAALQGEGRIDGKGEEAEEAWGQEWVSGPVLVTAQREALESEKSTL